MNFFTRAFGAVSACLTLTGATTPGTAHGRDNPDQAGHFRTVRYLMFPCMPGESGMGESLLRILSTDFIQDEPPREFAFDLSEFDPCIRPGFKV